MRLPLVCANLFFINQFLQFTVFHGCNKPPTKVGDDPIEMVLHCLVLHTLVGATQHLHIIKGEVVIIRAFCIIN